LSDGVLEIDGLTVDYDKLRAVDHLSFSVEKGQVCGFIGPNGAGKSTTMQVIATLLLPTEGAVRVKGIDVTENPRKVKKTIGYMPDFFGVYDNLKVFEYLEFFGSVHGLDRNVLRRRTGEVLEEVELSVKRDSYVEHLSRGMKQRLCLAKTLIHDPDLLILDEPASGLDPRARIKIKEIITGLSEKGKTVLVSSHIIGELEDMCSHFAIIELGKLLKVGTLEGLEEGKESDERVLRIRVLYPQQAQTALESHSGVKAVESSDDLFRVVVVDEDEIAASVIKALVEAGARPVSIEVERQKLADRFMRVTTGRVQ